MKNIYNLWLLDRNSGICLFEQNFHEWPGKDKSDLVAGFLYAILNISKELAEDIVSYIQLKDKYRISYRLSESLIFVVISLKVDQGWISAVLERIEHKFEEIFPDFCKKRFLGDINIFKSFAKETEKILEIETNYYSYFKARSEHLDEYLQKASQEWKSFQNVLSKHTKKMADWRIKKKVEIKEDVASDLVDMRERAKKNMENKKSHTKNKGKQENKNKNAWI